MKKKICFFSAKDYEKQYFSKYSTPLIEFDFHHELLSEETVHLAKGSVGCCCFVTDNLSESILSKLAEIGIKFITLRTAGFDHIDLPAARKYQLAVMRVPRYSPQSVAEFTVALILSLSRNLIKAYKNGMNHDFRLDELIGFSLSSKTVGIIGTGNIGSAFAHIIKGFGCKILAYDIVTNKDCEQLGVEYVSFEELLRLSDIISLHCPLSTDTHHMINAHTLDMMKDNVTLINTGRGGLIDTTALISGLKKGKIRYAGLDVYEKEQGLFFYDHSQSQIQDQDFLTLQRSPNVLITPHQAFLTEESLEGIAKTTIDNINNYFDGKPSNQL